MTSDAKVGLLLGLVFIFIIAFLINGLPRFRSESNNNELSTTMFNSQNNGFGLAARERKVIEQNEPIIQYPRIAQATPIPKPGTRFEMPLPGNLSEKKETVEAKQVGPRKPVAKSKERPKVGTRKRTLPKVYVVAAGDNLSHIAKIFYGDEEGNRLANVIKIFQSNRKTLKSADEIYEGQKIVIPPLPATVADKNRIGGVFPAKMFEKVKSIGRIRRSKDGAGQYVVRDGDSLWRIAAAQLGDATKWTEIARLNAGTLDDEDSLSIGMRLRLPTR